ncbi:putative ATP-binding cassette transporter [Cryphonectria parasitica EP155]|uniref:ATP-binding cassette transporter n=1 Tax=Cryphonectria parasitica (strain ATCC 38755 / EP155) TaxID=660469 RepID=A0A9P4XZV7_CRYP1|nr:putative ATP-binding cassette transporter [Cryphonectria parasitica EP155]KAF3763943.1 putative ATP-binding cassette transporter [Cryphonectria parasitica EP155]
MCTIGDVDDWGPFIQDAARCEHLSFTLLFEEALMGLLPSTCAFLLAVYRLMVLAKEDIKAQRTWMRTAKLGVNGVFAILALTQLCLYAVPGTPKTRLSLASSVILFLAALAFIPLSALEHTRSVRPSTLLEAYYALTFFLGIIHCHTLWLIRGSNAIAGVVTTTLVVRFLALMAETQSKRRILLNPYQDVSPDGTGGLISMLTLSWLLPLLRTGFSSSLSIRNLYHLHPDMRAETLLFKILRQWNKDTPRNAPGLLFLLMRQQKATILAGGFFRLCLVAFRFAQPFLVQAELQFSADSHSESSTARGTWLVVGYAAVYLGIAICQAGFQYHSRRFVVQLRGSLIPMLYSHVLRTDIRKATEHAPISLVSVDMEKMALGMMTFHETWASAIEIGLFIWLIERQIHVAAAASSLASLACLVAGFFISTRAMGDLTAWLEAIQRRIDITESVLSQFKPVALAGFMDSVTSRISSLRESEIHISKRYRAMVVGVLTMAYSSVVIAPVIGFGLFVFVPSIRGAKVFTVEVAFSSLTAFTLFTSSITSLVQATFEMISALSGFARYAQALHEPPFVDPRVHIASSPSRPPGWTSPLRDSTIMEDPLDDGDEDGGFPMRTFSLTRRRINRLSLLLEEQRCIVARDADIGWPSNTAVIKGASFSIGKNRITAFTGGPGSGKTTLLEAFLGQATISNGTLSTALVRAAYCSQKPWIFEGTIMDNIVNCCTFSKSRYEAVVTACGLGQEISRMPLGDRTPTGSGGSRLSGGQRKRVALARAVYCGLDLLILDDVLSGLDPETSKTVWKSLSGVNGLFRREGRTVIFSSVHGKHIRYEKQTSTFALGLPGMPMDTWAMPMQRAENDGPGTKKEQSGDNTDKQKASGDWQAYSYYVLSIGRRSTLILVVFTFLMVIGLQLPQIWIALWAQANVNHDGLSSATYYGIYVLMGGLALLFLVSGGSYFLLKMVPQSARILHQALLVTTLRASIVFINDQSIGSILNRFSQDLTIVDTDVPISGFNTTFYMLSIIVQAVIISISSKYMAAVMVVFLLFCYLVQAFYLRTSRQLRILDIEAKAPLISHVSDTMAGLKTIQSAGWTTHFETMALNILDSSQRPFYLMYCVQVWLGFVLDLMVAIVAILLVSITNRLQGSATGGFLGVALTSIVSFGVNLNTLLVSWTQIETALQAVLRIRDYSKNTPMEGDDSDKALLTTSQWPEVGRIEFRDVCASYGKTAGRVLDTLSFVVEPGTTVGICGRSGSGKSSLLATLYRFLDPESGTILIDGVDTQQVPVRRVRDSLVNVPQDAFLLPGSLRYNLDPSNTKSDEELIAALQAAHLWSSSMYDNGLDTLVDEYTFSSGQRQGLSLARALLREGNIVTVDELTSALDAEDADIMRETFVNHFNSRTVLMISHRLDDLLACDRVLVIEDGRFVEYDDTEILWEDDNSRFRRMFDSF